MQINGIQDSDSINKLIQDVMTLNRGQIPKSLFMKYPTAFAVHTTNSTIVMKQDTQIYV